MSAASVPALGERSAASGPASGAARRWIVSSWVDRLLILLTPLVATPAVLLLNSPWVGVKAETISLIVTAFFATGHHLPGLIRAYGDRDLFERFRWRFVLAPPLVFLAYFPLYSYHFDLYRLIILVWATWHGLMQLYGFVRIYDAKVGSIAPRTAQWDWLVCLCGFVTPQLIRPDSLASILGHWYSSGGPWIPAGALSALQWGWIALTVVALVGFAVNYVVQLRRGPQPNPLKLLMLISGVGMWWFAMYYVENLILGVALFDICHDVQYLAIVWLYNCRRVGSNADLGQFMRYVFRRGMVLLYMGLITSYGAIGLIGPLVTDGTVSRFFYGVLFTSTILHYYYDGFIWKVRESTNQVGLGLAEGGTASRVQQAVYYGGFRHFLKWSPAIIVLGLLFATDLMDPSLTTDQKETLEGRYVRSVMGRAELPPGEAEQSWLYSRFEQVQNIAATVPADRKSQLRAAIMLANFGRNDEAVKRLEQVREAHPNDRDVHLTLGDVELRRGNLDQAARSFETALAYATTPEQRSISNLKLGEICLYRNDRTAAEAKFQEALRDNPELAAGLEALRKGAADKSATP